MSVRELSVGVVGLGYWGPNLARNFAGLDGVSLRWCCDGREDVRARMATNFADARFTSELDDLLADPELDAIVLATPVPSSCRPRSPCARVGQHCFVEKPLAQSVADAERVVDAAEAAGQVLMVGHLLQYHPGINKLKRSSTTASSATSTTSTATA